MTMGEGREAAGPWRAEHTMDGEWKIVCGGWAHATLHYDYSHTCNAYTYSRAHLIVDALNAAETGAHPLSSQDLARVRELCLKTMRDVLDEHCEFVDGDCLKIAADQIARPVLTLLGAEREDKNLSLPPPSELNASTQATSMSTEAKVKD